MKVITWFHSNSELISRVIKEEVNVSEESSEDESDEDEDEDSDYEIQDDQVIFIRLIRLILIPETVKENSTFCAKALLRKVGDKIDIDFAVL